MPGNNGQLLFSDLIFGINTNQIRKEVTLETRILVRTRPICELSVGGTNPLMLEGIPIKKTDNENSTVSSQH